MLQGIDFSFGGGLTTGQIKAAGYSFVCRYLSGGNSKDISAAELANYLAAGIQVVFVWETTGTDMVSFGMGVFDANGAQAELNRLGAPAAPVFFAADEQTEPATVAYMQGVMSVIGWSRTGIYGGLGSIRTAFNNGVTRYGWQTYAWSGGVWDDRALLRQYHNGSQLGPAQVDLDQAAFWNSSAVLGTHDDYGQWPRPTVAPPPPPPPPAPAPGPVAEPVLQQGSTGGAVKLLQSLLNGRPVIHEFSPPVLVVDGVFGPKTKAVVEALQTNNHLVVDGIVGPQTWKVLGNYS